MNPTICRCCGEKIQTAALASLNVNMCASCMEFDRRLAEDGQAHAVQTSSVTLVQFVSPFVAMKIATHHELDRQWKSMLAA